MIVVPYYSTFVCTCLFTSIIYSELFFDDLASKARATYACLRLLRSCEGAQRSTHASLPNSVWRSNQPIIGLRHFSIGRQNRRPTSNNSLVRVSSLRICYQSSSTYIQRLSSLLTLFSTVSGTVCSQQSHFFDGSFSFSLFRDKQSFFLFFSMSRQTIVFDDSRLISRVRATTRTSEPVRASGWFHQPSVVFIYPQGSVTWRSTTRWILGARRTRYATVHTHTYIRRTTTTRHHRRS